MSDMSEFFAAGGVNMLPSGEKSSGEPKNNWKKALKDRLDSVWGNVKDALGVGQEAIEAKKAALSPIEKRNAELSYDMYLYDNIINFERDGMCTAEAIGEAHKKTLKSFKDKMPKEKGGKDYLVIEHAEKRLAESSKIESFAFVSGGYPSSVAYRIYKPEFKDMLKKENDARDYTTKDRLAQMMGNGGR